MFGRFMDEAFVCLTCLEDLQNETPNGTGKGTSPIRT